MNTSGSNTSLSVDLAFDRDHIWHPYTSMHQPLPTYPVVAAEGVRLKLEDGRTLIDGMSSWWTAIHGYNHPRLNAAMDTQLRHMAHVMFGGITHEPAIRLAKHLVALTPEPLQHVFFCDSGSVSVEVAIKMAIQYWYAREKPRKSKLLTIRSGYHGDTFQAMSVCDPETGMHHIFRGVLPIHFFADQPRIPYGQAWDSRDIASLRQLIEQHHEEMAAIILEPLVQGAGGMWFYTAEYLQEVRKLCDMYGILLIFDEIATGFGRTGELFACQKAQVIPDIMCVGKALTGGYMTLAATLASRQVARTISDGKANGGVFMHGPTFMGNPLACAVASASIELLLEGDWRETISRMEAHMRKELAACSEWPHVKDVRVLGGIGVIELETPAKVARIQRQFVDRGVWVRPFGRLVYIMPPYVISPEDLQHLLDAMVDVVKGNDFS